MCRKSLTRRTLGLTLIEALVVMGIVGILAAIAIPAVMHARQSAWRTQCANHLRQIGLGLTNYESVHGVFPPSSLASVQENQSTVWGTHVLLLPYIEQENLHDQINLRIGLQSPAGENLTAMGGTPSLYLCPADFTPRDNVDAGRTASAFHNYSFNVGNGFTVDDPDTVFTDTTAIRPNGLFLRPPVRTADVTDGLARTAAASERVHGQQVVDVDMSMKAELWHPRLDTTYSMILEVPTPHNAYETCRNLDGPRGGLPNNDNWLYDLGYTHQSTPNRTSCWPSGPLSGWDGSLTASSRHAGGVNVAFADGRVDFVGEAVDLEVWRAAATRDGGETIKGL